MNKLMMALLAVPMTLMMGCADEYDTIPTTAYPAPGAVVNGCIVVVDEAYGEREVCANYMMMDNSYVYWDPTFGIWVAPWGYYYDGIWFHGNYPGFREYYGHAGVWRGRGWYAGHGYHLGRGGYAPRGEWHGGGGGSYPRGGNYYHGGGGSYHGGGYYRGGGGFHGGGRGGGGSFHGGGHGGHR